MCSSSHMKKGQVFCPPFILSHLHLLCLTSTCCLIGVLDACRTDSRAARVWKGPMGPSLRQECAVSWRAEQGDWGAQPLSLVYAENAHSCVDFVTIVSSELIERKPSLVPHDPSTMQHAICHGGTLIPVQQLLMEELYRIPTQALMLVPMVATLVWVVLG